MEISHYLLALVYCIIKSAAGARFQLHFSSEATWDEARGLCQDRNRIFARVDSASDQKWVETLGPYTKDFFWIGLKGDAATNQFIWSDSSVMEYSNWAEGFPGTIDGLNCVRMRYFDFKWETFNCSEPLNFLCENAYHRDSYTVSSDTKIKGIMMGLGVFGGVLLLCCLVLQTPCCRTSVTSKIAKFGLGTKDRDEKPIL